MTTERIPTIRELRHARARYSHELKHAERRGLDVTGLQNSIKRIDAMLAERVDEDQ